MKKIWLAAIPTLIAAGVGIFFFFSGNDTGQMAFGALDMPGIENRVIGLVDDGKEGSKAICYDTETWKSTRIVDLPDVTSDNYAALSSDNRYLAYTIWDKSYVRRYLKVLEMDTGITMTFFQDVPPRTEMIKISWMPDNETLLYIKNDTEISSYQQIEMLNVKTGEMRVAVKGEVWKIRETTDLGTAADDFYLKGSGGQLHSKRIVEDKNVNEQWNYYLNRDDLEDIYRRYGGTKAFDFGTILNLMNVEFSAPKCSPDGKSMIYSAKLDRNSAPGERTPLWITAAIWQYDIETGKTKIIYTQPDEGSIGRVDWISPTEVCFVSYYDFQGSRDNINYLNLKTGKASILFHYSEEHYNNVTLLPIGDRKISFSSSARDAFYSKSETLILDVDTKKIKKANITFENRTILLENFIYN